MAEAVYILCAAASLTCTVLLLRAYRRGGARILLWSGLCFAALTVNNILLFMDKVIVPGTELWLARSIAATAGLLVLLYGLIWDAE